MPATLTQRCLLPEPDAERPSAQRPETEELDRRAVAAGDAALSATGLRALRHVLTVAAGGGVKLVGVVPRYVDKQAAQECLRRAGLDVTENAITVADWAA